MLANTLRKMSKKIPANIFRIIGNFYFPYFWSGIKATRVTNDYTEIDVRLKLTWYNRNFVGTQFGGNLYSMTDPFYMLMLIQNLSRDYIVWDKGAKINFKKPGIGTVYAYFKLPHSQISEIKKVADLQGKYIFDLPVDVVNEKKEIVANVIKTIYAVFKNYSINHFSAGFVTVIVGFTSSAF